MTYRVRLTRRAERDVQRLFDFTLARELAREGGGDPALAQAAVNALRAGFATLASSPFTCRKAGAGNWLRELIVPFDRSGYVALFEITGPAEVVVAAVRHQLEDDYH